MGLSPPLASLVAGWLPGIADRVAAEAVASATAPLQVVPINDTTVAIAGAVAILVLIGFSAFFSSSEIAMFSIAKHRVDSLVEDGVPRAETVAELKSNPHRLLVTILDRKSVV